MAGPNGAGKSTFYNAHLTDSSLPFVNADQIALQEFGNQDPVTAIAAAELAKSMREKFITLRESFIFETVLSDPVGDKVAFLAKARDLGYHIEAHFVGIANPALSQARVIHRVANGGHDVPDEKLISRYPRVMANLQRLIPVADRLTIYDNSEVERAHRPIAFFESGNLTSLSQILPDWITFLNLPSLKTPKTKRLP